MTDNSGHITMGGVLGPVPSFGFGPGVRISVNPLKLGGSLREDKWETLPKGWTDKSRDQYAKSMAQENKEGPVSSCMDKIDGHVDDPGAFCAALHDRVTGTTMWRGKSKEKEGGPGSGPSGGQTSHRGARIYPSGGGYRALTPTGHNIGPFKNQDLIKSHLDKNSASFGLSQKQADSGTTHIAQTRPTKTFESKNGSHKFKEATTEAFTNHKFEVVLIKEGLGNFKDCFFYTKASLQKAAEYKLFEGAQSFANHPSTIEEEVLPERSVRDILGYYENVQYKENADGQGLLVADLNVADNVSLEWAMSLLTNSIDYSKKFKESDLVGLSINASGSAGPMSIDEFIKSNELSAPVLQKLQEAQAKGITEINVVDTLTEAESVDMVTKAGAGGRILQMLEQERSMMKRGAALKESKKESKKHEAGEGGMASQVDGDSDSSSGASSDGADADHADAAQDTALFKKLIQQYLGKDDASPEEMEMAQHAYEACKEGGMEHEAAMEAAGNHLKMAMAVGKKMAQKQAEKHETHESHEGMEHEGMEHEAQTPPPNPKSSEGHEGMEGHKKESASVARLSGEVAKLRESVRKYELRDYLNRKMAESGKTNVVTKKFREALGVPRSKEHIDATWNVFIKAYEAGAEEVSESPTDGFFGEKTTVRESGTGTKKSSFADCVRE